MWPLLSFLSLAGLIVCIVMLILAAIKKKPKKPFLLGLLVCVVVFVISNMILASRANTSPSSDTGAASSISTANSEEPEANTSEMVDSIARQAKADAKNASEADLNNAYTFICENYKNCFDNNDTMEQMMYNGWLLEYAYEGNKSMRDYYNLGQDAEQLVKYVYRGAETSEDTATQENIYQIEKSINNIEQTE